ncbi:DOPA 4,5-dioxygenase family protein [Litoribacillus peritrichatus]|uniref:DOPA 4,5-dioxygenase family protein n=1 Tax=Litoribacillus peritrichatus TaxID=718191 RepID=A0ABP7MGJ4_9GAMM
MTKVRRPENVYKAYHAHVYFDRETEDVALNLCEEVKHKFDLKVGRFHKQKVGPHPCWSCQITFGSKHFEVLIPWLDQNRQGLSILVHALTGDDLKDHTDFAYWLGNPVSLNLEMFR